MSSRCRSPARSKFGVTGSATDPLSHTTSFSYDPTGNLTAISDPLSHQTALTYNGQGQVLTVADALGDTTSFGYRSGDLISITDPLSRITTRLVDDAGRVIALTDPLGQTSHISYDGLNDVTGVTDALGSTTSFTHDGNGNLLTVTDANGHQTIYTYDSMDRLATRTDPLSNSESYSYDAAGNLSHFTDRRGKVTAYAYDALNRRIFAGFGLTSGPTYESTITYNYDAGNRYTGVVDSVTGTITPTFDNLDRMTQEVTPQGTISYTYDNANRRTSATVSGQTAVDYSYDNANRLTQITQGTPTVSFAYDSSNRRSSLTLPNGVTVTYGYDDASELTGLTYTLGTTTLGNLTYSYDNAGRRTNLGGSSAVTELPTAVSTTTYNASNQLTAWGSGSLSYDLNGNLTNDGTNTYVWNARNKLSSMNSSATTFQYDPYGRRVAKTVAGITTNYLYDRDNIAQELSGGSVLSNWITGGTDEIFTGTDSTGQANFLRDGLGSTLALTNSSGSYIAQYAYEPFGKTTITSGSSTNEFQYTGRENDGTGLFFNRGRYYDPVFQRFVSEDPIGSRGGTNLTTYAGNSPTNLTDPLGLYPQDPNSALCALVGFASNYVNLALLPIGGSGLIAGALNISLLPGKLGCAAQLHSTVCQYTTLISSSAAAGLGVVALASAAGGGDIA